MITTKTNVLHTPHFLEYEIPNLKKQNNEIKQVYIIEINKDYISIASVVERMQNKTRLLISSIFLS